MVRANTGAILAAYKPRFSIHLAPWASSYPPYLQLLQSETPTGTDTAVILDGWASDNWPQLVDWAGSNGSSLGDPGISPTELTAGLVEVSADAGLPLLSEVVVGDLLWS